MLTTYIPITRTSYFLKRNYIYKFIAGVFRHTINKNKCFQIINVNITKILRVQE